MLGNKINEFKNGEGYIKWYYYDGKLHFECHYLNGDNTGKYKEYYDNGKIKFEGEYLYNSK